VSREERDKRVTCEAAPGSGVTSGLEGSASTAHQDLLVRVMEVRLGSCHVRERWED
jgi:hypothetical protein